ncbi:MAG: hypothetical protein RSB64_16080, partial [Pseudomonas sp.]
RISVAGVAAIFECVAKTVAGDSVKMQEQSGHIRPRCHLTLNQFQDCHINFRLLRFSFNSNNVSGISI